MNELESIMNQAQAAITADINTTTTDPAELGAKAQAEQGRLKAKALKLAELANKKQLYKLLAEIYGGALDIGNVQPEQLPKLVNDLERIVFPYWVNTPSSEMLASRAAIMEQTGELRKARKCFKTGFQELDKLLNGGGGISDRSLVIIGAGSGVGKTAFAMQLAANATRSVNGTPSEWRAVVFNYELSPVQLQARDIVREAARIVMLGSYDKKRHSNGAFDAIASKFSTKSHAAELPNTAQIEFEGLETTEDQREAIDRARLALDATDVITATGPAAFPELNQLEKAIRLANDQCKADGKKMLVIIDYLHKIDVEGIKSDQSRERLTAICNRLCNLRNELECAIVAISAVNRDDKREKLDKDDLRDSSAITFDADLVALLQPAGESIDEQRKNAVKDNRPLTLIIGKSRQGGREGQEINLGNHNGQLLFYSGWPEWYQCEVDAALLDEAHDMDRKAAFSSPKKRR